MHREVKMGALILWKSPTDRKAYDLGVVIRGNVEGVVIVDMQRTGVHPLRVDAIQVNESTLVD
jgi:hypothetical protein